MLFKTAEQGEGRARSAHKIPYVGNIMCVGTQRCFVLFTNKSTCVFVLKLCLDIPVFCNMSDLSLIKMPPLKKYLYFLLKNRMGEGIS